MTGDLSDFDAFATTAMPGLRRLAHAWCRDSARADDLVQAALERVYAAWPRVRDKADPLASTRTTMIRVLISEQRRPWFRREVTTDDLPPTAGPEDDIAGRLDLVELVHRLPPRQRLVLLRKVRTGWLLRWDVPTGTPPRGGGVLRPAERCGRCPTELLPLRRVPCPEPGVHRPDPAERGPDHRG